MSVREMVKGCQRCHLHTTCTSPVPLSGPTPCNLLVVGEAPGATEDKEGAPFVGSAGGMLRGLLKITGFNVEKEIAWCNVVSCRPPGNRNPKPDEIASCRINLEAQIMLANPRVILLAGGVALSALRPDMDKITQYRGRPLWIRVGQIAIPTFHPAAVLRKRVWQDQLEQDCRLARKWVKGKQQQVLDDWPGDCAICGLEGVVFDTMGVGYCKYHKHIEGKWQKIPVQERLLV